MSKKKTQLTKVKRLAKTFDGETVLNGLIFDLQRMMREQARPSDIIKYGQRKFNFLANPGTYRVRWWNVEDRRAGNGGLRLDVLDEIRVEVDDGQLQDVRQ